MAALAALPVLFLAGSAKAQDRNGNFLDNLFNRGEPQAQPRGEPRQAPPREAAQPDPSDVSVRIDRLENALRQLTGTIEQLQYQNQQLQMQVQQLRGSPTPGVVTPGVAPPTAPGATPNVGTGVPGALQPPRPGNRSDVFDPSQRPNAPGAPRVLGNTAAIMTPEQNITPGQVQNSNNDPPVGAPGGRDAGAPLDLSTLSGNPPIPPTAPMADPARAPISQSVSQPVSQPAAQLPPPRGAIPAPVQLATLPPTASAQDEYDMAYGYVLHKDYALAEQSFRDFVKKYPNDRLVPDAQYWLGESLFQRQRYRDAAELFLAVSTKYDKSGKAPESLLRLGQSLAAMNSREPACATLAEVGRKYPRASANVKRGVEQEQKRAHC
jgi:tol-pal system protein YbgF